MKQAGKYILIIPEGWCEYNYAQSLKSSLPRDKQRSISVEMPRPDYKNTAVQLLSKAVRLITKAKKDKNPYDAVWLFFDNDNQTELEHVFRKIESAGIKMAYSSISIEHWFILHLENIRTPYINSRQALRKIESLWEDRFNKEYHKTKVNHFKSLKDYLETAIQRAEQITTHSEEDDIPLAQRNPYFTVQELITFFRGL